MSCLHLLDQFSKTSTAYTYIPPLTLTPTYVRYSRPSYKYEDFIFPPPQSSPHPCLTEILVR
ncbi:uncharacterized protein LACBIDRAFT_297498 [Laccaria bicolor S238N-H82]|uniref:Predicted protein n=1 Tax=Laccaria bicolor (strain S238N-H82 / ATCC MYA-4686) TaxID=486041 RepID=B0DBB9_LACBS|nr:uncharacterized protein LACBIDRAFT_297498 [Laccaria bicolor S238N-H82]EDR07964.1 predicted protein [Laccaria bicolor S238N-H82]|eukprot:XP_001881034.1 predicted protein [Laccaria bicolor S238N-H82]